MQQLEKIFFSRQCIKILRHLSLHTKWEFSLKEISEDLNIDKSQVYRILHKLKERKIVIEIKKGKFSIFRLNKDNLFVKKLVIDVFKVEKNLENKIFEKILHHLKPDNKRFIISIIVYGSVLTPKFTLNSDIDLMIIIDNSHKKKFIESVCDGLKSAFLKEDIVVFVDVISKSEFLKLYRLKEPLFNNLIKNGKVIYGKELNEVILDEEGK